MADTKHDNLESLCFLFKFSAFVICRNADDEIFFSFFKNIFGLLFKEEVEDWGGGKVGLEKEGEEGAEHKTKRYVLSSNKLWKLDNITAKTLWVNDVNKLLIVFNPLQSLRGIQAEEPDLALR